MRHAGASRLRHQPPPHVDSNAGASHYVRHEPHSAQDIGAKVQRSGRCGLTFSCYRGYQFLQAERTCAWLQESIDAARMEFDFALWAYVFMPEHATSSLSGRPIYDIAVIRREIKAPVGRKAIEHLATQRRLAAPITRLRGREPNAVLAIGRRLDRNIKSGKTLLAMIGQSTSIRCSAAWFPKRSMEMVQRRLVRAGAPRPFPSTPFHPSGSPWRQLNKEPATEKGGWWRSLRRPSCAAWRPAQAKHAMQGSKRKRWLVAESSTPQDSPPWAKLPRPVPHALRLGRRRLRH